MDEDDDIDIPMWPAVQMLDLTPCFEGSIWMMELET